jgi:hypothetical protein
MANNDFWEVPTVLRVPTVLKILEGFSKEKHQLNRMIELQINFRKSKKPTGAF